MPSIYLAGWQASREKRELEVIKRSGMKWRCFSFANLVKIPGFPYHIGGNDETGTFEGSCKACIQNGVGVMIDSGIISYRGYKRSMTRQGKTKELAKLPSADTFVELYVKYVKKNHKNWDFYVTVDMAPIAKDVLIQHKKIVAMGIRPVPVFHGDVAEDWLKRYVDLGYTFICLGGSAPAFGGGAQVSRANKRVKGQYLDRVFNFGAKHNIEFHGLGLTSPWTMLSYPWRSCDSSWWSRSAGYGSLMRFCPVTERMSVLHISPRESKAQSKDALFKANKPAMQRLREELKEEGFDLDLLREDFTERHIYNAKAMMQLAEAATKRQRGTWNQIF